MTASMDTDCLCDAIRESVSALRAGEALGLTPDRHGRCACPIHNGKDRNLKLWADDRGYHCFVCHAGGDVISLVMAVNGCTFYTAICWLNSAFNLGLPIGRPADENAKSAAKTRQDMRKMRKETARAIDRMEFDLYTAAVKAKTGLEDDAERYRPAAPDAPWDERFCAAMRMLPEMREAVKELEMKVIGVKE